MRLLPHQRWANGDAADLYRPIGRPFYAISRGETYSHDCDVQMWWVYCEGFCGAASSRMSFGRAKEMCDKLNLAVVGFFETRNEVAQ